jgi:putative membrane protein
LTVILRWLLASFHLLALGIGLGAIYVRARSLQAAANPAWVRRVLRADTWWGVAALLWLATGLPRLFLGLEKPTNYYVHNHVFWLKMALFLVILLLELGPMMTFTGWRRALRRGATPNTSTAARWAMVSRIQLVLLILILFTATAVAKAFGA